MGHSAVTTTDIASWVREKAHVGRVVQATDRLRRDLGIDGARAAELMTAFAAAYVEDMGGYNHRRFFSSYDWGWWGSDVFVLPEFTWLFRTINPSFRRAWDAAHTYEISIAHLTEVAQRRTWFDPPPVAHPPPIQVSSPLWQKRFEALGQILLLPFRIFWLAVMAAIFAAIGYSIWVGANALIQRDWSGALDALVGFALFATWALVILRKTAARIQARLGVD